jgi:zinc/manganese transport system permease protein
MSSPLWEIMLPAFAECLVLTGLSAYLGLHVLRRKVIFVDLTLAQIAALGTTVGLVFGMSTASVGAYVLSVALTICGAAVFAMTRLRDERVPHEAVIGLVYAVAAALAILLVAQAPHGAKQVKSIMTGRLLWVDWGTVGVTTIVYATLGVVHYLFRRQFLLVSDDPERARRQGMSVWWWDFLFYVTFGVAISLSVRTAGVLLVFVFLVVPAMVAVSLSTRLRTQLVVGWVFGTLVTATGLALSYGVGLPSGPTVVAFYGLVLVPIALVITVARARRRARVLRHVAVGTGLAVLVVAGFMALGEALSGTRWALAADADHEHFPETHAADRPDGPITHPGHTHDGPDHEEHADQEPEDVIPEEWAPADGVEPLLEVLRSEETFPFEKDEAASALDELAGQEFGYDPEADEAANAEALGRIEAWAATR